MISSSIQFVLILLYVALPAMVANMMPVIVHKLGWFKFCFKPVDAGRKFRGEYLFGKNKTWRGIIVGTLGGGLVGLIQYLLASSGFLSILFFSNPLKAISFGLLGGLGALIGDLVASFFKRRLKKPSGSAWPVFDHIDYILGFLLFTSPLVNWTLLDILVLLLFASVANPFANKTAFRLGVKNTPT